MTNAITRRVLVVAAAVAVALALWGVFRLVGVDLTLKEDAPSDELTATDVVVATVLAGLAALAVQGTMSHFGVARYWPVVGSTALSISMIGPGWLAEEESLLPLIAMHFAVAIVLIMGFSRFIGYCEEEMAEEEPAAAQRRSGYPHGRLN
jgi:hypothetical protein